MRWQPGDGFVRLDRHLARLAASAAELGFRHESGDVLAALDEAVHGASTPLRTRLVLSQDGAASASAVPFEPLATNAVWNLKLAQARLDSKDLLLRHKTSRREIYVQARAEHPAAQADEVLLANERGELCEGAITTLFLDFGDGHLATPRLECGLLAGVLRAELLDSGEAKEAIVPLEDLGKAKALFVGNSLRGLIPARLA
jgi:4-amino-4-deoxychorismate lyase